MIIESAFFWWKNPHKTLLDLRPYLKKKKKIQHGALLDDPLVYKT